MARKKKREGISLIALLITIVVLIILAGVSISAIKNNNGIINQTSHAQEKKNASEEKEAIEWAAAQMVGNANNLTGQIADKQTEEEITNEKISTEEYIKNINQVSKEDIIKIANSLQINTIYFLKNKEED